MLDLCLLSIGPFLGWLIYMGALEPLLCPDETRFNHLLYAGTTSRHVKPPKEPLLEDLEHFYLSWDDIAPQCDAQQDTWREIKDESRKDALKMAKRALEAIPDASCVSVAEALNLPVNAVKLQGDRGRRKGKEVTDYSREQIFKAATMAQKFNETVTWN